MYPGLGRIFRANAECTKNIIILVYISRGQVTLVDVLQQTILPPLQRNTSLALECPKRTSNSKMDFFSTVHSILFTPPEAGQQDTPVDSDDGGPGNNGYCIVA